MGLRPTARSGFICTASKSEVAYAPWPVLRRAPSAIRSSNPEAVATCWLVASADLRGADRGTPPSCPREAPRPGAWQADEATAPQPRMSTSLKTPLAEGLPYFEDRQRLGAGPPSTTPSAPPAPAGSPRAPCRRRAPSPRPREVSADTPKTVPDT